MGWSYCGINTDTGEEMGYAVEGICHHPDCDEEIDHGLAYVCGGMHQNGETCGYYFCLEHLLLSCKLPSGEYVRMCKECAKLYEDEED